MGRALARRAMVVLPRRWIVRQLQRSDVRSFDLSGRGAAAGPQFPSVLAGPTCDSIDVIRERLRTARAEMGDFVVGRMHGRLHLGVGVRIQFFSARRPCWRWIAGACSRRSAPRDHATPQMLAGTGRSPARRRWRVPRRCGRGPCSGRPMPRPPGKIALTNLHTGERLDIEYFRGRLLRARRACPPSRFCCEIFATAKSTIDSKLMDYLVEVARTLGVTPASA